MPRTKDTTRVSCYITKRVPLLCPGHSVAAEGGKTPLVVVPSAFIPDYAPEKCLRSPKSSAPHKKALRRSGGVAPAGSTLRRVAVEQSNLRWCSDGFEIGCDNKEKVRVAFALDCCDREAIAHVATTEGIKSEDVQDLVITAVENRFGLVNKLPKSIEWLTDNGSCFIAKETKTLLIDIGMEPCSTPVRSPQSNGMAEAFVKTFKRDYVSVNPLPDAMTVIAQLPAWFEHYNTLHPHKALGYRSPREFLSSSQTDMRGAGAAE